MLGDCYYNEQNYDMAIKWYRKAAEQGNCFSQASLGDMYYEGNGVKRKYKKAVKWYTSVAEQGHLGACFMLGLCYEVMV